MMGSMTPEAKATTNNRTRSPTKPPAARPTKLLSVSTLDSSSSASRLRRSRLVPLRDLSRWAIKTDLCMHCCSRQRVWTLCGAGTKNAFPIQRIESKRRMVPARIILIGLCDDITQRKSSSASPRRQTRLITSLRRLRFFATSCMQRFDTMTATTMTSKTAVKPAPVTTKAPDKDTDPNHIDYTANGGPSLTVLWSKEPLSGQTLYLGGEVGSDGKIYCIPGHAARILLIDPETDDVCPVGPVLPGKFKWLRGVRCGDVIYGLPCHKDSVLKIHVPTRTVSEVPIPYETFYTDTTEAQEQRDMEWKYHGGTTSPIDGCIYCIPQSAWHVLKIDPATDTCTFVDSEPLKGRCKWYGGVVGKQDGAIYGIPHNSASVLRIDPEQTDNVVTLHGDFGPGGHKWHGAAAAPNGTIVSVPANADTVLCVTPARPEPILQQLGSAEIIQSGRHRLDNKYKFLGAMAGTDGKVYCFPCASERVLQIDVVSNRVCSVGPNLVDENMERIFQNKWQNGLTSTEQQCVYAIPLAADTILKIDTTNSNDEPVVMTYKLPESCHGLAKFEGGVLAPNGVMYTCPNNFKGVLRIASSKSKTSIAQKEDKGQFRYTTGIPTLRSSAHRVKLNPKQRKHDPKPKDIGGQQSNKTFLPKNICEEATFQYNVNDYDFKGAMVSLLQGCDPEMVGSFSTADAWHLEGFEVPTLSLSRSDYGGHCESAQVYFSNAVATNKDFLDLFDRFVVDVVLPKLKARLVENGAITTSQEIEFYYQRPPTVRLQPGPAWADVKAHSDAEYGHQNGELNFWLPLTNRDATGVDLWCESSFKQGDYHPLAVNYGDVVSFHGSSCRHYVNANHSNNTRVSLDFRIGIQGFFDTQWQMAGTTDDHNRRTVRL